MLIDMRVAPEHRRANPAYYDDLTLEWVGLNGEMIIRKCGYRAMREGQSNVTFEVPPEFWDDLMHHLDSLNARDFRLDYIDGKGRIHMLIGGHSTYVLPNINVEPGTVLVH